MNWWRGPVLQLSCSRRQVFDCEKVLCVGVGNIGRDVGNSCGGQYIGLCLLCPLVMTRVPLPVARHLHLNWSSRVLQQQPGMMGLPNCAIAAHAETQDVALILLTCRYEGMCAI
eukprot:1157457-Pelagomonas_calceolata.AAC.1